MYDFIGHLFSRGFQRRLEMPCRDYSGVGLVPISSQTLLTEVDTRPPEHYDPSDS